MTKAPKNVLLYSWQLHIASKHIWTKDVRILDVKVKVFIKIQMKVILEVEGVFQKPELESVSSTPAMPMEKYLLGNVTIGKVTLLMY